MRAIIIAAVAILTMALFARPDAAEAVSCNFVGGPFMFTFGNYDPVSGNAATATMNVTFTCSGVPSGGTRVTITADKGSYGATLTSRSMQESGAPSDLLPYTLSLNANYSPVFGDGTGGTSVYTVLFPHSADRSNLSFTVYGTINAAQAGGAGDVHANPPGYADKINLTLTY